MITKDNGVARFDLGHWLPKLVLLLAPYFYLRAYGFDFSRGTSFSLVDLCLFILLAKLALEQRWGCFKCIARQAYAQIGIAFIAAATIATLFGRQFGSFETPLNWVNLISSLAQYGFVLIALPLLAIRYYSWGLRRLLRWIALAYLPPILMGLLALNHAIPGDIRELFYSASRAIGTYGNANSYAVVLLLVLPNYTYLALTDAGRWHRVGWLGQTVTLVSLILTVSFSGLLMLMGMLMFVLYKLWRYDAGDARFLRVGVSFVAKSMSLCLVASGFLYLYEPAVVSDISPRLGAAALNAVSHIDPHPILGAVEPMVGSASQRLELMYRALAVIGEHGGNLFWGVGLGNSRFSQMFTFGNVQLDVHNLYLLLWLESGLVSVFLFLAFLFVGLKLVEKNAEPDNAAKLAISTSIIVMALTGLFSTHLYLRYFWIPMLPVFMLARQQGTRV